MNELVNGKRGVTTETALMLAKVLGTSPQVWLYLQQTYELYETLNDPAAAEKLKRVKPVERDA